MFKNYIKQFLYEFLSPKLRKKIAISLLNDLSFDSSELFLEDAFTSVDRAQLLIEDRIRHLKFSGREIISQRAPMQTWIMDGNSPWMSVATPPINMPGMITDEEAQYYEYIGTLYEGSGEAIELGPWLGKSTRHIMRGLQKNPNFASKKLYVFDDFVWRTSWMNPHAPEHQRFLNNEDFRPLFEKFVSDILPDLIISKNKICDYEGNEHLPKIKWDGQPIEIMYIDCGRTLQVNKSWFEVFSPSFIPDVTLLIMQDWRTHRERPRLSYNETMRFTAAHSEMELIHEVSQGCVATFLYRGA